MSLVNYTIALLVVDMLQSRHVPKLDMYSLLLVETTNDMPFCLVETSKGTYLLSYWKHIKCILTEGTRDGLLNIFYFY